MAAHGDYGVALDYNESVQSLMKAHVSSEQQQMDLGAYTGMSEQFSRAITSTQSVSRNDSAGPQRQSDAVSAAIYSMGSARSNRRNFTPRPDSDRR
jgi:hypothetical protein